MDSPVPDGPGPGTTAHRSRRTLLVATGLAVALLVGLVVAVGPAAILAPLVAADPIIAGLAVLAATASLALRHLAYDSLCRRTGASPTGARFHLLLLAAGLPIWLLPFGYVGGPVITASYLARGVGARFEASAAAMAVSEILSLITSGFVLGVGLLLVIISGGTTPSGSVALLGLTFVALSAGGALVFVLAGNARLAGLVTGLGTPVLRTLRRFAATRTITAAVDRLVGDRFQRFRDSLTAVAIDRLAVTITFVLNVLAWLAGVLSLSLAASALGLSVPFGVLMVTVPLAAAAGAVPVPAGLGPTELAYTGLLVTLAGASPAVATAVTLLFRVVTLGLELLLGGLASLFLLSQPV